MKQYPIIAKKLFHENVHEQIKEFIDKKTPLLPLQMDNSDFIRTYLHNTPFFVKIHYQLKDFASEHFGEPVKPSYCFLSMYKENGICPLHIDRPQCRYTIDYLIQSTHPGPWPIHIGHHMSDDELIDISKLQSVNQQSEEFNNMIIEQEEWNTILLEENDAVLYSGTHSWHYRSERLKGTADLVFFHFVPEDFDGPLD